MGNTKLGATSSAAGEAKKKHKKKGRPSLLDLQRRRSLRSQNPNPSPTPNPRLSATAGGRRATRLKTPPSAPIADDDDESDAGAHRRREKKLRLVLRAPNSADSGSDSESGRKVKVDAVVDGVKDSAPKVTDTPQEPSDCGPTVPLPDKKLLLIILDKLQKKDTYGVYSEPVDPNELPDYLDIIKLPMDFGTIRKKLASGGYATLEQFEKDVFLICSNAMQYNAPDTIYYRQAQRIQELAEKKFEYLRQHNDENELEPRPARRGRPPSKNTFRKASRPPSECDGSDFSTNAALVNARENTQGSNLSNNLLRQESDRSVLFEEPGKPCILQSLEARNLNPEFKMDRNEDYSGSGPRGFSLRNGKKFSTMDDNRRLTYTQPQIYGSAYSSVLTALSAERKQLLPVGLHVEHAYARSLARFAANLGPIGWEVAEKLIERVLPPGSKFGHGWVGNDEIPKQTLLRTSSHSSRHETPQSPMSESIGDHVNNLITEDSRVATVHTQRPESSTVLKKSETPKEGSSNNYHENGVKQENGSHQNNIQPRAKIASQLHQNPVNCTTSNGLNSRVGLNELSKNGDTNLKSYNSETMMTNSRALDMLKRKNNSFVQRKLSGHFNNEKASLMGDPIMSSTSNHSMDSKQQCLIQNPKTGPVPPDLNVGFQSPGSPASGTAANSPRPDLALQL